MSLTNLVKYNVKMSYKHLNPMSPICPRIVLYNKLHVLDAFRAMSATQPDIYLKQPFNEHIWNKGPIKAHLTVCGIIPMWDGIFI